MKVSGKGCLVGTLVGLALMAQTASAVPIELGKADFIAQTSSLATIIENFEGLTGSQSNPVIMSNGMATMSGSPSVGSVSWLCGNLSQCLWEDFPSSLPDIRTFSSLADGTIFWGTDVGMVAPENIFRVTVVGSSGTLTMEAPGQEFWGFYDAAGILAISFENLGSETDFGFGGRFFGNYAFDNVVTAANVPEPSSLMLLIMGGLLLVRRFPLSLA